MNIKFPGSGLVEQTRALHLAEAHGSVTKARAFLLGGVLHNRRGQTEQCKTQHSCTWGMNGTAPSASSVCSLQGRAESMHCS